MKTRVLAKTLGRTVQHLRNGDRSKGASFDASCFNDPIAMWTDWTPANPGGSQYRIRRLVKVTSTRLEFRVSPEVYVLCIALAIAGGWTVYAGSEGPRNLMPIVLGLLLIVAAAVGLFNAVNRVVSFDLQKGIFRRGSRLPNPFSSGKGLETIKLNEIHALQVLSEYVRGRETSYYSYELNLILKDGHRINLLDHANEKAFRKDLNTLAEFLGVPVWDATSSAANG